MKISVFKAFLKINSFWQTKTFVDLQHLDQIVNHFDSSEGRRRSKFRTPEHACSVGKVTRYCPDDLLFLFWSVTTFAAGALRSPFSRKYTDIVQGTPMARLYFPDPKINWIVLMVSTSENSWNLSDVVCAPNKQCADKYRRSEWVPVAKLLHDIVPWNEAWAVP